VTDEPKRRGGRPSKLTRELISKIENGITMGLDAEVVVQSLNVSPAAYYEWCANGRANRDKLGAELVEAVTRARARGEARLVQLVQQAAERQPEHAKWLLEKHPKYGQRWGNSPQQMKGKEEIVRAVLERVEAEFAEEPSIVARFYRCLLGEGATEPEDDEALG
jgi:hypothetical protein